MAHINSSPLPPQIRLTSAKIRRSSQSPSRSPERRSHFAYQVLDPLLSNLSPESTLQALTSVDAVPKNEKTAQDLLTKSISKVSTEERALGIRSAVAAKKLKEWYKEVLAWQWPKKTDAQLGKGFIPPTRTAQDGSPASTREAESEVEYFGSLPAEVVQRYETRIEEIRDGMDSLDVEELKEHVLNAHIPARSRPSSSASTISIGPPSFSYVQLSDFTAIVTATILRLLPTLSRLNFLLTTWDVRLLVLRQIPGLLAGLQRARVAMDSSMAALTVVHHPEETDSLFSRDAFHSKRTELETIVVSTGRRMDKILDALEGREDSLPETWIDDLEAIEADFSTWAVEAEKRAVMDELMRLNKPKPAVEKKEPEAQVHQLPTEKAVQEVDEPTPEAIAVPQSQPVSNVRSEDQPKSDVNAHEVTKDRKLVEISANIPGSVSSTSSTGDKALQTKLTDGTSDLISNIPKDSAQSEEPHQRIDVVTSTNSTDKSPKQCVIHVDESADLDTSHSTPEGADYQHVNVIDKSQKSTAESSRPTSGTSTNFENNTQNHPLPSIIQDVSRDEQYPSSARRDSTTSKSRVQCPSGPSLNNKAISRDLSDDSEAPLQKQVQRQTVSNNPNTNSDTSDEKLSDDESASSVLKSGRKDDNEIPISPKADVPGDKDQTLPGILVDSIVPDGDDSSSEQSSSSEHVARDDILEKEPENSPHESVDSSEDVSISMEHLNHISKPEELSTPSDDLANHIDSSHPEQLDDIPHVEGMSEVTVAKTAEDESHRNHDLQKTKVAPVTDLLDQVADDVHIGASEHRGAVALVDTDTGIRPRTPEPAESLENSSSRGVPFSSLFSHPRDRSGSDARNQTPIRTATTETGAERTGVDEESPKLILESPIKMSKLRPKPLSFSKGHHKPHCRNTSDLSGADSPVSDCTSLSSPETREPYTSGSPTTPLIAETPTPPQHDYSSTNHARSNSQATLRQEHLYNFNGRRGPSRPEFKHCRTASLPLQRFMNEDVHQDYDEDFAEDVRPLDRSLSPSPEKLSNDELSSLRKRGVPLDTHKRTTATRHSTSGSLDFPTRETGSGNKLVRRQGIRGVSDSSRLSQNVQRPSSSKAPSIPARSNKRLHRPQNDMRPGSSMAGSVRSHTPSELSRPASPLAKAAEDELEEKINSILNTIPARIRLTHAPSTEGLHVNSSSASQRNERLGSVSPRWPSSRSSTPTPSLYLTPAYNRARRAHSHTSEEGSVRVYHLHRGKTAPPTKLFVRTVGEGGERVMVRVGGGWADLGEYLREYAIHHGARRASEQPKVEVQEIPSHSSPSYSSPGGTPIQPSNNGRTTPSRPGSSLSSRSPSSLAVRKTRQPAVSANEHDHSVVESQIIGDSASPMSVVSSRNRRFSISSNNSISMASTGDSPFAGSSHSAAVTPLGLAGPKPRSRRVSMSPESEAWVEDVLGQARINSSLKPPKPSATRTGRESSLGKRPSEPKLRSVSDMGSVGLNKRVLLRGLDRTRRESSQGL